MILRDVVGVIDRQRWLDRIGKPLESAVSGAFSRGGAPGQQVKDFLHGTWLGHPLHPALSDVPIGAWTAALVLDSLEVVSGRGEFGPGADAAVGVGLAGAVGSAVTGLNDWQHLHGRSQRVGLVHGVLNAGATLLYTASLLYRRRGSRGPARGLASLGYAVVTAAAYLGGDLVYDKHIGVNHTTREGLPREFVPVLDDTELREGELRCVDAKGAPVMLVRAGGRIHALANTCSHLGGPLCEGTLHEGGVVCPWHGSRFDLETGEVLDGPAVFPVPRFETRVRDGRIELRAER